MPTTLITFADNEVATYEQARTIAQDALSAAQAEIASKQSAFDAALEAQEALERSIAADRALLAKTSIPAEIEALVVKLTEETIDWRRQSWAVAEANGELSAAKNEQAFAETRLVRASADLDAAAAALERIQADDARRAQWKASLAAPPLDTLRQQATDVIDGTNGSTLLADALAKFTTAPTRVPQRLMDLAEARHALWRARADAARAAIAAAQDDIAQRSAADLGKPGASRQAEIAFERAQEAFATWVQSAQRRYTHAVSRLEQIANLGSGVFALTQAEAEQANDTALATDRDASGAKEADLVASQRTLDPALASLADAQMRAQADDPNAADVSGDPAVAAALADVAPKQADVDAKTAAFTAADHDRMADWQVRLADATWQWLLDFYEAKADLSELKAQDPAALRDAMDAAEGVYGDALAADSGVARSIAYLEDALLLREATSETATAAQTSRLIGAVRGDAD